MVYRSSLTFVFIFANSAVTDEMSHSPWSTMFAHIYVYEFSERFNVIDTEKCYLQYYQHVKKITRMGSEEMGGRQIEFPC